MGTLAPPPCCCCCCWPGIPGLPPPALLPLPLLLLDELWPDWLLWLEPLERLD